MTEPLSTRHGGDLGLLFEWIVALRRGDVGALAALLDPDVTWHGLDGSLCVGREAVLDVLGEQLPLRLQVDALELISAPDSVVVGTRSADLPRPPDTELEGQIYNVFEQRGRRYVTIRDFARREDALRCSGGREPAWR